MPELILASTSPYRHELLSRLGLPFSVRHSTVDETAMAGEDAAALAARLALGKATAAVAASGPNPEIVIGADQVASRDGVLLRKPGDHATALEQLLACQGRTVVFHTAAAIVATDAEQPRQFIDTTEVDFLELEPAELDRYLEIDRPYDCAGGFKAEGLGIMLFRKIRSEDPSALIGLPLISVAQTLREFGLNPLSSN